MKILKAKEKDINDLFNFISSDKTKYYFHLNDKINSSEKKLSEVLTRRTVRNAIFSDELDWFLFKNEKEEIVCLLLLTYPVAIRRSTVPEVAVSIVQSGTPRIDISDIFNQISDKYTKISIRGNDNGIRLIEDVYKCNLEISIPNSSPSNYYACRKED